MTSKTDLYAVEPVDTLIVTVRGQKVILDSDLARVYGVPTKRLNEQIRRNSQRFPQDFAFRLSAEEATILLCSRSQNATLKRGQNIKYLPFAFTEHGAVMAASVLNTPSAVRMSIFVVRAFIKMREHLLKGVEMEKRLAEIEKILLSHDTALRDLFQKIRPLLLPTLSKVEGPPPDPPRKQIGFHACPSKPEGRSWVRESHAKYSVKRGRK